MDHDQDDFDDGDFPMDEAVLDIAEGRRLDAATSTRDGTATGGDSVLATKAVSGAAARRAAMMAAIGADDASGTQRTDTGAGGANRARGTGSTLAGPERGQATASGSSKQVGAIGSAVRTASTSETGALEQRTAMGAGNPRKAYFRSSTSDITSEATGTLHGPAMNPETARSKSSGTLEGKTIAQSPVKPPISRSTAPPFPAIPPSFHATTSRSTLELIDVDDDGFDIAEFEFDDFATDDAPAMAPDGVVPSNNLGNKGTPGHGASGPSALTGKFMSKGAAARSASIAAILAAGNNDGTSTTYSGSGKSPFPTKQSTLVNPTTLSALNAANAVAGPSYRPFQRVNSTSKRALPLNAYTYQPTAAAAYQTHLPFRGNGQTEGKTWNQTQYAKSGRKTALSSASKGKGKAGGKQKKRKKGFDPFGDDSDDEGEDEEEIAERERIEAEEGEEMEFDQFPKPFIDPNKPLPPPKHLLLTATTGTYIYPINIPKRDYQYEIIRSCFMDNTLVALPTGLGKTFIAGVVLLNFYRWFPTGKLVFLMPTKPLVTQQHEACQRTCGIPSQDAATITGDDPKGWREETWASKRVIYATPQVFRNDMKKGRLDPQDVVLVIIGESRWETFNDEAHKASGNHDYVQCISYLTAHHQNFRIVALSATPGRSTEKVQDIIDNLHISKVEIREAEAPEISKYMFAKQIFQHVVPAGPVIMDISRRWGNMMKPYVQPLVKAQLLTERSLDVFSLKSFTVTSLMMQKSQDGKFFNTIKILGKMALGMGYLLEFSLGMFHQILLDMLDGSKGSKAKPGKNAKGSLRDKPDFKRLLEQVETLRNRKSSVADQHPKLELCKNLLIDHLGQDAEDLQNGIQQTATKCMVFCSFRGAVGEIVEMLNEQQPLIRAHKFVGRSTSNANGGDKGLTQVEQKAVIEKFKKGEFNVLVATSIGEEGLDIGEVDFIIIYNCPRESIKMLQRIGRAGRKRDGKIHVFMTEGREDRNWDSANQNHREIQAEIICGNNIELYSDVKRILPGERGQWPTCIEQVQEVDEWVGEDKKAGSKRKRASLGKVPANKKARGEAVPEGAMDGFVLASALTHKRAKGKKPSKDDMRAVLDSSDADDLPSLSAAARESTKFNGSWSPGPPKAKAKRTPAKLSKRKPGLSKARRTPEVQQQGGWEAELFGEMDLPVVRANSSAMSVGRDNLAEAAPTSARAAGYSQVDAHWMLDDSDNEFDPLHIETSVLARQFKPPSMARVTPRQPSQMPSARVRPPLSRDMLPPSVPPRVLSTLQLNQSPLTDNSPMPVRRNKKGKAVIMSSPDNSSIRQTGVTEEGSSPVPRALERRRVTKARPQHQFIDYEAGVSDEENVAGSDDDDSSGQENESDRRFAGHFLPTQAPKGYNQRAAYAAGLGTQAGAMGPAFEDRNHLREAFFAKARRPVLLSQEEAPREGPSSEYEGSFVCGDDTVEYDTDN